MEWWWLKSIIAGIFVCMGAYIMQDIKDVAAGLLIALGVIIMVKTINKIINEK